ncbi:MAG: sensor histidine kinase, partial [Acidimicrobiales bacterium]
DDPLQSLVHVARRLELVAVHEGVAPDMAERLAAAHAELLDTARRLRDLAQGLRPPALDRLGLAAALQGLVAEEEDGVDTALRLDFTKVGVEQRLVPECELGLYRIAQEALHNALEHASPTRVEVSLTFEESLVLLAVENDGAGFDPIVSSDHAHLGVQGMRERAGLLGGTLVIDSSPDGHTRVTATVPLRPAGTTGETEPCQPADVDVPATGAPTAGMPVRSGPPPRDT